MIPIVNTELQTCFYPTAMCLLSDNVTDYYYVSQGKTSIPGVDDGEECQLTDVSPAQLAGPGS